MSCGLSAMHFVVGLIRNNKNPYIDGPAQIYCISSLPQILIAEVIGILREKLEIATSFKLFVIQNFVIRFPIGKHLWMEIFVTR